MERSISIGVIGVIVGFVGAWITITNFVITPMEQRIERAWVNIQNASTERIVRVNQALAERDARMDYLQQQIDELERIVPRRSGEMQPKAR